MKNKKRIVRMIAVMLMLVCCVTMGGISSQASTRSNMNKMVRYFCKGKYRKANKYNNKLPEYASESCVNKMSQKMKGAYRNQVKKVYKKYGSNTYYRRGYQTNDGVSYYLTDLDNDKKAELIVNYYPSKSSDDVDVFAVYDYKGGKVVKLGGFSDPEFSNLLSYPGHKGLLCAFERKGIALYKYTFKNGKSHEKLLHDATYNYSITNQLPNFLRNRLREYAVRNLTSIEGPLQ